MDRAAQQPPQRPEPVAPAIVGQLVAQRQVKIALVFQRRVVHQHHRPEHAAKAGRGNVFAQIHRQRAVRLHRHRMAHGAAPKRNIFPEGVNQHRRRADQPRRRQQRPQIQGRRRRGNGRRFARAGNGQRRLGGGFRRCRAAAHRGDHSLLRRGGDQILQGKYALHAAGDQKPRRRQQPQGVEHPRGHAPGEQRPQRQHRRDQHRSLQTHLRQGRQRLRDARQNV